MSSIPDILCTFVGDIRRDSRLLRMARSLAGRYRVGVLALGKDNDTFMVDDVTVTQWAHLDDGSLRRSLRVFWKEGSAFAATSGARLFLASDLYSLPAASGAAKRLGARLLYDSREWYRAIAALTRRPLTQMFWTLIERRHAARADAVLTVNDTIAGRLRESMPGKDVVVLRNYPAWKVAARTTMLRDRLRIDEGQTVVLSQGGLQEGRGAIPLIDAIARLDAHHLVFLGDGAFRDRIRMHAEEIGAPHRVHIVSDVTADELGAWTASADIGCCIVEALGESYTAALPNKLFEYIAAGVPVVASDFPEIGAVVRAGGYGVTVDPRDPSAIADAIARLAPTGALHRDCVSRCRSADVLWEKEEGTLLSLVERLLDHSSAAAR
jgi:glycogen synthase